MNREIKFRAWYEKSQSWVFFDLNIGFTEEGFKIYQELLIQKVKFYQYTGLEDKNGVEIYEGDIVDYFIPDGDQRRIDEVKFISGCFVPDIWRTTVDGSEVIGNIYENPELIK